MQNNKSFRRSCHLQDTNMKIKTFSCNFFSNQVIKYVENVLNFLKTQDYKTNYYSAKNQALIINYLYLLRDE